MNHPAVDELPEQATMTLLNICDQLSMSAHAGLARWASSVSDALLIRLMSLTSGARFDVVDFVPSGPLALLDAAELDGLHAVVIAGAMTSDDAFVVEWCTRMDRLIVADFCRRAYEQVAVDAKAAAMVAEERRLACVARITAPHLRSVSQ